MSSLSSSRRESRLNNYDGSRLSLRQYNITLCGTLFYGILLNFIICAVVGDITEQINPVLFLIGYFACAVIGCCMSGFSKNPIISFIGYNLVVVPYGLAISICVQEYGGISSTIVVEAFLITMCITGAMTLLGVLKPEFCSKLGGILFASLIGIILAELVMLIMGIDNIAISWISAVVFSLYISYDVYRSQAYPPTLDNAVDSALDIYLDIANLFLDILRILGNKSKD